LGYAIILVLTGWLSAIAFAQNQSQQPQSRLEVFNSLRNSALQIRDGLGRIGLSGSERRRADSLLDSIDTNASKVQAAAQSRRGAPVPEEYLRSLNLDAELMSIARDLSHAKASRVKMLELLREVAEDLEAKVIFSQNVLGAGLRLIEFIVHTYKNGQEVGGYEVWYVPRGWSDTPDKFRIADQPSSPAIMNLAPGNYFVWLKKGKMATEKLVYTLGKDGSRKEVSFPIP
jgi:hypothetical protein